MVLRINPSKALLWRNPNEVQFGSSFDAVKLSNLTVGQERLLGLLTRGIADDYFDDVAEAVGAENPNELLQKLDGVLLKETSARTHLTAEFIEARFAEICRIQASHSTAGAAVLSARQKRTVFVQSKTSAEKLILHSLRQSGIGNLTSKAKLADNAGSPTDQREVLPIDFAVLLTNNAIAPSDYRNWMLGGVPHISAVFDAEGVTISPVIESGKSACLSCFHENQTQLDAAWPAVASQLLFSAQEFDDSAASLFAAAVISQKVLQLSDQLAGLEPAAPNVSGYRLSVASGQISEVSWRFNSNCACRFD